jgi:hypothetical protein
LENGKKVFHFHKPKRKCGKNQKEANIAESKAFLRSFVKQIEIDKSQVVIHYNLPMPNSDETQTVGVLPMVTPGGAEGIRTPYLLNANQAFSQLNYGPIYQGVL